jgi:hypothetical protein
MSVILVNLTGGQCGVADPERLLVRLSRNGSSGARSSRDCRPASAISPAHTAPERTSFSLDSATGFTRNAS